ncbi:MAG: recombinase family protein, partial [Clostridiaceae bacterium]|nr:recombinase family protein [Clostridiaceae bacterium]
VQKVLNNRSADTGEKGRLHFLLRGVVYCNVCGQRLTGEVHKRGSYYRCIPDPHSNKCDQPYIPVNHLDNQLEKIYAGLQPPEGVLRVLKIEMRAIAEKRMKTAKRDIEQAQKTLDDIENKEIKLLDEMIAGKLDRCLYDKLQSRYTEQKAQAQERLAQMQVDYNDPLDFLDKCIVVASMLLFLHQRFDYEHRKNLLKAVFKKIYVENKDIVAVEFTPPFKMLLGDDLRR